MEILLYIVKREKKYKIDMYINYNTLKVKIQVKKAPKIGGGVCIFCNIFTKMPLYTIPLYTRQASLDFLKAGNDKKDKKDKKGAEVHEKQSRSFRP